MNFDLIGAAIAMWKGINGGKFNTGAATVLLTFGFQKFLPQLGLDHDRTTIMVSTIIQAVGYVVMIVGAIHKIIKAWMAKKNALPTSGAAVGVPPVAKLLILGFLALAVSTQAKEIFNRPMNYFLTARVIPQGYNMLDTAYWVIKPSITVPLLQLRESSDSTSKLDVSTMASAGGGITYERDVVVNGKNYSTMSLSIIELLADNPPGYRPDFAAGIVAGIYNNVIQFGVGYDFGPQTSKSRWFAMAGFGIALTRN
jgi:hypothetical protein